MRTLTRVESRAQHDRQKAQRAAGRIEAAQERITTRRLRAAQWRALMASVSWQMDPAPDVLDRPDKRDASGRIDDPRTLDTVEYLMAGEQVNDPVEYRRLKNDFDALAGGLSLVRR